MTGQGFSTPGGRVAESMKVTTHLLHHHHDAEVLKCQGDLPFEERK
jgi:hypothetical protein